MSIFLMNTFCFPVFYHNYSTTTTAVPGMCTPTDGSGCVVDQQSRCGTLEIDGREHCNPVCANNGDCGDGQWCWGMHENYCGSFPHRSYTSPVQDPSVARCGYGEIHARTFCGDLCGGDNDCADGQTCHGTHSNYCGSDYTTVDGPQPSTTQASPTTVATTTQATTR